MSLPVLDGVHARASLSPDGRYRYALERHWFPKTGRGNVLWIMLNPSTADASLDDRTTRVCQEFSRSWGFDGITIGNLFAYRSRDPHLLRQADDPVGPANDDVLSSLFAAPGIGLVVAAWGVNGSWMRRDLDVVRLAKQADRDLHVLRLTLAGHPWHPLYLKRDLVPEPWRPWEIYG